jgi:hypothetical protein
MEETNEYLNRMVGQMIDATGVPTCFICGKRIVGMHIDYMDKDRVPRKVCIGCVFTALDFYLNEREGRMHPEAINDEK